MIGQVGTRNGTGLPDLQDPRDLPSPAGDGGLEYRARPSRSEAPVWGPGASPPRTSPTKLKPRWDVHLRLVGN